MTADKDAPGEATQVPEPGALKPHGSAPYLIVLAGAAVGEIFRVEIDTVLGRDDTATIPLRDQGVSRRHARITVDAEQITLLDLGSTNGTFLNGDRVVGPAALRDGDKISIGSTTVLKFTHSVDLQEKFEEARLLRARYDALTGAAQRSYFDERLKSEFAYALRHQVPLAVLLLDLDRFSVVNNTWGYPLGDAVLAALVNRVRFALRTEDIFARYGGEEFAIICRGTSAEQALSIAERVRDGIGTAPFMFPLLLDGPVPITVSVGVGVYPRSDITVPAELLSAAELALGEAKRSGGNAVRVAPAPGAPR